MTNENIYKKNRGKLADILPESLIVIPAFSRMQHSNDGAAAFLQESNFLWLTGLREPNWLVVIDTKKHKSFLVAPNKNDYVDIFDGTISYEDVRQKSGVEEFLSKVDLGSKIKSFSGEVYTILPKESDYFTTTNVYSECKNIIESNGKKSNDATLYLSKLRAIKQDYEIEAIKKAIKLTTESFERIKSNIDAYNTEYEIEAEFGYDFRRQNAQHAYDPIVASGKNALTLHYMSNSEKLTKNSFVLIDIGARVDDYVADITRTYVYGEVGQSDLEIYQKLTESQRKIIDLIKPGFGVKDYIEQSDKIMMQCLYDLRLISNDSDYEQYRKIMPHAISHGMGLDVHDSLGAPEFFEPGMVLTVEPGIYLKDKNIGMRVEDDILVGKDGAENLSVSLSTQC